MLISKDFVGGKPDKVQFNFEEEGLHDDEGRTITLHFKSFLLVAVYVPNSGVPILKRLRYRVQSWDQDFKVFLRDKVMMKYRKPLILCGDLNISHHERDIW